MLSDMRRQPALGMSLLETVLVLVVLATLLLAGISRYQKYRFEAKVSEVNRSVILLQQALTEYFYRFCRDQKTRQEKLLPRVFTSPADLFNRIGWQNKSVSNPLGGQYELAVMGDPQDWPPKYKFELWVSARFNVPIAVLQNYRQQLNATCHVPDCSDGILVWWKLPNYVTSGVDSNLWILNAGLLSFTKSQRDAEGRSMEDYLNEYGVCANLFDEKKT